MINPALNQTGSKWEQYVDNWMTSTEKQVNRFKEYVKSPEGRYNIGSVQMVATFATTVILGLKSPFVVGASAFVGTVIRAFSPEQLESISDTVSKISDCIPTSVKVLGVVIAHTYAPILFPVVGGLYAGFGLGAKISPHDLAKGADKFEKNLGLGGFDTPGNFHDDYDEVV